MAPDPAQSASQATIRKLNVYVSLLNRTLRASESLARYESWANMRTGPTGRERIIYGLYSLYDVRSEIGAARTASTTPPAMQELDAQVAPYTAAYEALAPILAQANGYYERQDYKEDKMAEGKALHARLAPAAQAFLAERAKIQPLFAREKERSDAVELSLIEAREGRTARWHVTNVMARARPIIDLMPTDAKPLVDMPAFEAALSPYATAVRELDDYALANSGTLSGFESRPRSWLGKLREFRDKLGKSKGDARRGAGRDVTWIVNDYNTMISMAQMASTRR
ncbi:YiiG family protein [uncultured Enterovirga sp.]|uniref:YiiG family protein n=1 Tax=uncultured Enterovirga sp. TaxID=2026352 RepID=UPI0035CA0AEA